MEGRHDHWTTFDEDHPSTIPTKYGLLSIEPKSFCNIKEVILDHYVYNLKIQKKNILKYKKRLLPI
jgi:hypothetical protein